MLRVAVFVQKHQRAVEPLCGVSRPSRVRARRRRRRPPRGGANRSVVQALLRGHAPDDASAGRPRAASLCADLSARSDVGGAVGARRRSSSVGAGSLPGVGGSPAASAPPRRGSTSNTGGQVRRERRGFRVRVRRSPPFGTHYFRHSPGSRGTVDEKLTARRERSAVRDARADSRTVRGFIGVGGARGGLRETRPPNGRARDAPRRAAPSETTAFFPPRATPASRSPRRCLCRAARAPYSRSRLDPSEWGSSLHLLTTDPTKTRVCRLRTRTTRQTRRRRRFWEPASDRRGRRGTDIATRAHHAHPHHAHLDDAADLIRHEPH